jgi:hypothetical protein
MPSKLHRGHHDSPSGQLLRDLPRPLGQSRLTLLQIRAGPVIKTTNMGKTTYLTDDPQVASRLCSKISLHD